MRHPFMDALCEELAGRRVATFRYQFPYMEAGRKRPDAGPVLQATVRSAVDEAVRRAEGLPLVAGGKSMGGRMTSLAASSAPLSVQGLIFFGFPLHASGKPSRDRGDHLFDVKLPMLFLQGTRDRLAELELLKPLCAELGERTTLHVVDGGDHSFHVLKRSGRTDADVFAEIGVAAMAWTSQIGRD